MFMNTVEQIKEKLDIVNVVGQYVELKKSGRNYKGLCPFHHEKTPSFMISPEKQIAYCFGCHRGGDIFRFIMEIENVDFNEALKILAEKAGVTIEDYAPDSRKEEKDVLREANRLAAEYYAEQLTREEDKKGYQYLRERGLTNETIVNFNLGYASDQWDGLLNFLTKQKKLKEIDLVKAGLIVKKDQNKTYDRFRGRIMFPLTDGRGKVVGFTGRALTEDNQPKYLNTADTPIFNKSNNLFGLEQAKPEIRTQKEVLLMEGQFDVLSAHQAGFKNAVAASGTAYTRQHIKILARLVETFTLVFDSDEAGKTAVLRTLEAILPTEKNVMILSLPQGDDPDSLIKRSKEDFEKHLKQAKTLIDFLAEDFFGNNFSDLRNKRQFLDHLSQLLQFVRSPLAQDHYIKEAAQKLNVAYDTLVAELGDIKTKIDQEKPAIEHRSREDYLIGLLLSYPQYVDPVIDKIPEVLNNSFKYFFIYRQLSSYYNDRSSKYSINNFLGTFSDHILQNELSVLALIVSERYQHFDDSLIEKEVLYLLNNIKKDYIKDKIAVIKKDLERAETNQDNNRRIELLKRLQIYTNELA